MRGSRLIPIRVSGIIHGSLQKAEHAGSHDGRFWSRYLPWQPRAAVYRNASRFRFRNAIEARLRTSALCRPWLNSSNLAKVRRCGARTRAGHPCTGGGSGSGTMPYARWGKRLGRAPGRPQRQFQAWGLDPRKRVGYGGPVYNNAWCINACGNVDLTLAIHTGQALTGFQAVNTALIEPTSTLWAKKP
jgi:hypothetical protein